MLGLFFKYGAYGDNYGSIFAIGDLSFCIAFSTGPIATSQLTEWVGFDHMLQIIGLLVSDSSDGYHGPTEISRSRDLCVESYLS